MLEITDVAHVDLPCIIEVDPYLPLSFKTFDDVLPGARYFRLGNFDRSLLEIAIDPSSFVIRGAYLVVFDQVLAHAELVAAEPTSERLGLPVVKSVGLVGDPTDQVCDFSVHLADSVFSIDWAGSRRLTDVIRYASVSFFLSGCHLLRIAFGGLDNLQMQTLEEHLVMTRAPKREP